MTLSCFFDHSIEEHFILRAIALSLPLISQIHKVPIELFLKIQNLFYHSKKDIGFLAISLYYLLLAKYSKEKPLEEYNNEYLFPIFSTDDFQILSEIVSQFFSNFFANLSIDYSKLLLKITEILLNIDSKQALIDYLKGIIQIVKIDTAKESILKILQYHSCEERFFNFIAKEIPLTVEYSIIFDFTFHQILESKWNKRLKNSVPRFFQFFALFPEDRLKPTQELLIELLKALLMIPLDLCMFCLEMIHSLLKGMNFSFIKKIEIDILLALYEFYSYEDLRVRNTVKDIVISIQQHVSKLLFLKINKTFFP
jgi:hypothetical protein